MKNLIFSGLLAAAFAILAPILGAQDDAFIYFGQTVWLPVGWKPAQFVSNLNSDYFIPSQPDLEEMPLGASIGVRNLKVKREMYMRTQVTMIDSRGRTYDIEPGNQYDINGAKCEAVGQKENRYLFLRLSDKRYFTAPLEANTDLSPAQLTKMPVYVTNLDARYYHRKDCRILSDILNGAEPTWFSLKEAVGTGRSPCPTCNPPTLSRPKPQSRTNGPKKP